MHIVPVVLLEAAEGAAQATTYLSGVITQDMINGVFNEILALLPIVLPCIIGFAGIRKGIRFILSAIHGA